MAVERHSGINVLKSERDRYMSLCYSTAAQTHFNTVIEKELRTLKDTKEDRNSQSIPAHFMKGSQSVNVMKLTIIQC